LFSSSSKDAENAENGDETSKTSVLDTDKATLAGMQDAFEKRDSVKPIKISGVQTNGTTMRFYKKVGIVEVDDAAGGAGGGKGFALHLNDRPVHTPLGKPLVMPTRELALAVAVEWDSQGTHVRPVTMPLMTLVTTAIDQVGTITCFFASVKHNSLFSLFVFIPSLPGRFIHACCFCPSYYFLTCIC
jgi:hypothetical protein